MNSKIKKLFPNNSIKACKSRTGAKSQRRKGTKKSEMRLLLFLFLQAQRRQ
jgi:hypothetical protein